MAIDREKHEAEMNDEERYFFAAIRMGLLESGCQPFVEYLDQGKYNLKFTEDLETPAYVESKKRTIFINSYFFYKWLNDDDIDPVLMLVKHEILHKALDHEALTILIIADQLHVDPDVMDSFTREQLRSLAYAPSHLIGSLQNITGDYHIGRYYTKLDKRYVKALEFYGQKVSGLLNDLSEGDKAQYPGVDFDKMSFKEIYQFFQDIENEKLMSDPNYEHVYGEFDDNDEDEFTPLVYDSEFYLGVDGGLHIKVISDDNKYVMQNFSKYNWFKVISPKEEFQQAMQNKFLGMTMEDFTKKYPYLKVERIGGVDEI